jgi:hypothetical protein
MPSLYIDNDKRKRIVTFWIPVCLVFLHVWASVCIGIIAWPNMPQINVEYAYKSFKTCNWGIWGLILLLISDKAVEYFISRIGGALPPVPQVVEKTTTETIKTMPAAPVETATVEAQDVNIKAQGSVNVGNN